MKKYFAILLTLAVIVPAGWAGACVGGGPGVKCGPTSTVAVAPVNQAVFNSLVRQLEMLRQLLQRLQLMIMAQKQATMPTSITPAVPLNTLDKIEAAIRAKLAR